MRPFRCQQCQSAVFFENTLCTACGAWLGFVPATLSLQAFVPPQPGDTAWAPAQGGAALRPCLNRSLRDSCNWMLDEGDTSELCASCRLTAIIPDLSAPGRMARWRLVEQAKRRALYTLRRMGLQVRPRSGDDDLLGLRVEVLDPQSAGSRVLTGHDRGVITLNLDEADDVQREQVRASFGEPWRTLLGHFRHEIAHHLFYVKVAGRPEAEARFRAVFGDERADYGAALALHHQAGPTPGWEASHISAYASSHPHEDWAEICAHVQLIQDALETAQAWGLHLDSEVAHAQPQALEAELSDEDYAARLIDTWLPVGQLLNAMNRSLGLRDSYPFQLTPGVLAKLVAARSLLVAAPGSDLAAAHTPADASLPDADFAAQPATT